MKKPIIEVKCDMSTGDTLVFEHEPHDTDSARVWAKAIGLDGSIYIRMSCERALALGKALVETYGNEAPKKITI